MQTRAFRKGQPEATIFIRESMTHMQHFRTGTELRTRRPATRRFALEALEARRVLSANLHASALLGTIGGTVTDATTGAGVGHVRVQLMNSHGAIAQQTITNGLGQYRFNFSKIAPFVVREVTPRGFVQLTPTFAAVKPGGALIPGATGKSWNYSAANNQPSAGPVGPNAWDTIAPAGDLPFESPINLKGRTVDLGRVLTVNAAPSVPSAIINNGHQIQVQFATPSAADAVTVNGTPFYLTQFHFHDPAENLVNGHRYRMEEHFVTTSASGAETVVAVFLQLGQHNKALDPILNAASSSLTKSGSTTTISTAIDFAGLLPRSTRGWFYTGSLTTPPLSQPVNWFVLQQPITLDAYQLYKYEQVATSGGFLPNARPVQPTDGRVLNEIDNQVNFTGTSISTADFTIAKA